MTQLRETTNEKKSKVFEIIRAKDYEEMSRLAARRVIDTVTHKPNAVLGLATGSTPEGLYKLLIEDHRKTGTSYKEIKTVNLDEYVGLDRDDKNSYYTFMKQKLFNYIDVNPNKTFIPDGTVTDLSNEALNYENLIHKIGGVDLQILGIGHNGHIGFNEPGTPFGSKTHIVTLDKNTREANARYFKNIDEVPTHAITMGIQSIMDSKEIILLASGASKAEAIKRLIDGEITEEFPASVLQLHNHVTIIADEDALRLIESYY